MIRASLSGRCGADPIQRETRTGKQMTTVSIAVDVGRSGEEPTITEWIGIVAFGTAGEALAQHRKGDVVAAMGALSKSSFTGRDGREKVGWSLLAESVLSARTTYDRPHETTRRSRGNRSASRYSAPKRSGPVPDLVDDNVDDLFLDPIPA